MLSLPAMAVSALSSMSHSRNRHSMTRANTDSVRKYKSPVSNLISRSLSWWVRRFLDSVTTATQSKVIERLIHDHNYQGIRAVSPLVRA